MAERIGSFETVNSKVSLQDYSSVLEVLYSVIKNSPHGVNAKKILARQIAELLKNLKMLENLNEPGLKTRFLTPEISLACDELVQSMDGLTDSNFEIMFAGFRSQLMTAIEMSEFSAEGETLNNRAILSDCLVFDRSGGSSKILEKLENYTSELEKGRELQYTMGVLQMSSYVDTPDAQQSYHAALESADQLSKVTKSLFKPQEYETLQSVMNEAKLGLAHFAKNLTAKENLKSLIDLLEAKNNFLVNTVNRFVEVSKYNSMSLDPNFAAKNSMKPISDIQTTLALHPQLSQQIKAAASVSEM